MYEKRQQEAQQGIEQVIAVRASSSCMKEQQREFKQGIELVRALSSACSSAGSRRSIRLEIRRGLRARTAHVARWLRELQQGTERAACEQGRGPEARVPTQRQPSY